MSNVKSEIVLETGLVYAGPVDYYGAQVNHSGTAHFVVRDGDGGDLVEVIRSNASTGRQQAGRRWKHPRRLSTGLHVTLAGPAALDPGGVVNYVPLA